LRAETWRCRRRLLVKRPTCLRAHAAQIKRRATAGVIRRLLILAARKCISALRAVCRYATVRPKCRSEAWVHSLADTRRERGCERESPGRATTPSTRKQVKASILKQAEGRTTGYDTHTLAGTEARGAFSNAFLLWSC